METTWPCFNIYSLAKYSWKKLLLCIWWDQLGVVYSELLKPNEAITGAVYQTQLMRLSWALKEKRAHYYSRHDIVILLHDNTCPHVAAPIKIYLETLKWEVFYRLKRWSIFPRWYPYADRKMEKSNGNRWTILRIKHKVPFFYNKCPIFYKKWRKLICTPDTLTRVSF